MTIPDVTKGLRWRLFVIGAALVLTVITATKERYWIDSKTLGLPFAYLEKHAPYDKADGVVWFPGGIIANAVFYWGILHLALAAWLRCRVRLLRFPVTIYAVLGVVIECWFISQNVNTGRDNWFLHGVFYGSSLMNQVSWFIITIVAPNVPDIPVFFAYGLGGGIAFGLDLLGNFICQNGYLHRFAIYVSFLDGDD